MDEQIHRLPSAQLRNPVIQSNCDLCKKEEAAVTYCTDDACKKKFCKRHKEVSIKYGMYPR